MNGPNSLQSHGFRRLSLSQIAERNGKMSKQLERRNRFYKIMAAILAGIMIAGTVLGVVLYFI